MFSTISSCIAHALLYRKKVIISLTHSIAGPTDLLFNAMPQALRGPFRRIVLALLTLIAQALNGLCCIVHAQLTLI